MYSSVDQIIVLPEFEDLKEEIKKIRKELANWVCQRDELKYTICENIKIQYLLEFGDLEYKFYEAYCHYLRLRRKRDLIQVQINRQEAIDLRSVELKLNIEFSAYQEKLNEKMAEMDDARWKAEQPYLSEKDLEHFKKLYRNLVKHLHPDLNPNLTEIEKDLFHQVVEAYKNGDLVRLELINQQISKNENWDESLSKISLEKEKFRLENLIDQLKDEIQKIKQTPPYTWRVFLIDEVSKQQKKNELLAVLDSYKSAIRTLEEAIEDLVGAKP